MLGRVFQVLLCFLIAMQPPSKSLFADFYHRIGDSGQPTLITLVDNAVAELADVARNVDGVDQGKISPNHSYPELELPSVLLVPESNETDEVIPKVEQPPLEDEQNVTKPTQGDVVVEADNVVNATIEKPQTNDTDVEKKDEKPQEDIPSFSEWAQKQLEEAEKNKEVSQNDSSQSLHKTVISTANLKVRSKNYASPDCGAKIVAVNPEAGSASYILSSSRDEYMLNTCNSRIWFIVELCEAIQAKKIELANFELFSSTPKNFSVSVSDRFPTREWAGVGQFIAKDERDIQVFNLHPHLFGKFIKVELHSHYGSEHYCPISLFRVYGTSEFEVFETENSQANHEHDDDDDDDIENIVDASKNGDGTKNLFGSARDAVMSIMKKAAEVLVKSGDSKNASLLEDAAYVNNKRCQTPSHIVVCENCSNSLFSDVYDLMSCEGDHLKIMAESPLMSRVMCDSNMCQPFGLDFKIKNTSPHRTEIANYISAFLLPSYVAALCNMLAISEKKVVLNTSYETDLNITSNLTIDKKANTMIKVGMLDKLLQEPFNDKKDDCQVNVDLNAKEDETSKPPQGQDTTSDIQPTKTIHNIVDDIATIVVEAQPFISKDPSIIDPQGNENHDKTVIVEEKPIVENSNTELNNGTDGISIGSGELPKTGPDATASQNNSESGQISNNTAGSSTETSNSSPEQLAMDSLLSEYEQNNDFSTPAPTQNSMMPPLQGQKESVFLRLSNRIKALEKNMSLSGQYLEELSRRYKKQVEEMQKTFEKTLLTVGEESRRAEEREHKYTEDMLVLQQQIAQLSVAVGLLLSERDSWFGGWTFLKLVFAQIIVTVVVLYIYKRTNERTTVISESVLPKNEVRRNSVSGVVHFSEAECVAPKRRLSAEEILRHSTDLSGITITKSDKKKRKRKTSTIHRSVSLVEEANRELGTSTPITVTDVKKEWAETPHVDSPIALEEAEFIGPDSEPIDFSKMGEPRREATPKKEFPKTNGSIFKPVKERRLSSPAFFKAAHTKQNSKSEGEIMIDIDGSPSFHRNGLPLDLTVNSPHMTEWPSAGELSQISQVSQVSQASTSTASTPSKSKRSKKTSFKNMLKKVF